MLQKIKDSLIIALGGVPSMEAFPQSKRKQDCWIIMHPKGHPMRKNGMFQVYPSKWRAISQSLSAEVNVKRLTIEL